MTISPCAMLMTPITPKVMARPIAASSSTEPSDRPYQAFCTIDHSASRCWIAEIALGRGADHGRRRVLRHVGQHRQRFLVAARADGGDGIELLLSVASSLNSRIAARATVRAALASRLVSFFSAVSISRQHRLVMGLEHRLRGLDAFVRVGRGQRQPAERGLDGAAQTGC